MLLPPTAVAFAGGRFDATVCVSGAALPGWFAGFGGSAESSDAIVETLLGCCVPGWLSLWPGRDSCCSQACVSLCVELILFCAWPMSGCSGPEPVPFPAQTQGGTREGGVSMCDTVCVCVCALPIHSIGLVLFFFVFRLNLHTRVPLPPPRPSLTAHTQPNPHKPTPHTHTHTHTGEAQDESKLLSNKPANVGAQEETRRQTSPSRCAVLVLFCFVLFCALGRSCSFGGGCKMLMLRRACVCVYECVASCLVFGWPVSGCVCFYVWRLLSLL